MIDNPNRQISVVNTRGRVVWIHPWEIDLHRQQGAKVIHNPKQSYYPEYDQELNGGIKAEIIESSDSQERELAGILDCEVLS